MPKNIKGMPPEYVYRDWMNRDVQPLTFGNYMDEAQAEAQETEEGRRNSERQMQAFKNRGFVPNAAIEGAEKAGMSPVTAGMLGVAGGGAIMLAAYGLARWKLQKMREEGEVP